MANDPPTLVHSQATSDTAPGVFSYAQTQRSRCKLEFTATQSLYRAFDADEGTNREERLLGCRSSAWFVRSNQTGLVRVASNHCRLRWCPLCARSRAGFITHSVKEWLPGVSRPKLVTFTIKHSDRPLFEQIEHIYSSFRAIRRCKKWRSLSFGGVWFFQLTWNPKSKQWHPHIHVLMDSDYIPYMVLRRLWYYYTAGSDVVDIRAVYKIDDAAQYVARYASRPHDLKTLPLRYQKELVTALHGKRMCGKWGTAKSIPLSPYSCPKSDEWTNIGSWSTVHELARTDATAREILRCYHTNEPLDPSFNLAEVDAFIDSTCSYEPPDLGLDPIPPPPLLF